MRIAYPDADAQPEADQNVIEDIGKKTDA